MDQTPERHELECGHNVPVKPLNGCAWCPMCGGLMVIREPAAA